jgi:hypothetical protein
VAVKILTAQRLNFETFYTAVFHAMPMATHNVYMLGNINNRCKTWSVMLKLLFGLHRGREKERGNVLLRQLKHGRIFYSVPSHYGNYIPFIVQTL